MCTAETMCITKKVKNALQTVERKIWKTILGPVKTGIVISTGEEQTVKF